jgi:hypothetical protein
MTIYDANSARRGSVTMPMRSMLRVRSLMPPRG